MTEVPLSIKDISGRPLNLVNFIGLEIKRGILWGLVNFLN